MEDIIIPSDCLIPAAGQRPIAVAACGRTVRR
jgi:hypothetical protein